MYYVSSIYYVHYLTIPGINRLLNLRIYTPLYYMYSPYFQTRNSKSPKLEVADFYCKRILCIKCSFTLALAVQPKYIVHTTQVIQLCLIKTWHFWGPFKGYITFVSKLYGFLWENRFYVFLLNVTIKRIAEYRWYIFALLTIWALSHVHMVQVGMNISKFLWWIIIFCS